MRHGKHRQRDRKRGDRLVPATRSWLSAALTVAAKGRWRPDQLAAINAAMDRKSERDDNLTIPAGYTYLAQFVAHDLAFHSFTDTRFDGTDRSENYAERPGLDLSSLYGPGPEAAPHLYRALRNQTERWSLRLGAAKQETSNRLIETRDVVIDGVKRGPGRFFIHANSEAEQDLPRCPMDLLKEAEYAAYDGTAVIADPRNDEHVIISQLTVLFSRVHNLLCDKLKAGGVAQENLFYVARAMLERSYREIIARDLLAKLLHPEEYKDLFPSGDYRIRSSCRLKLRAAKAMLRGGDLPEVFWRAAFRVGHAMVQDRYLIRTLQRPAADNEARSGSIRDLIVLMNPQDANDGTPLKVDWIVEWERFFFGPADLMPGDTHRLRDSGAQVNYSHALGLTYALSLVDTEFDPLETDDGGGGLPYRDIARGQDLPCAQDFVAQEPGLDEQTYLADRDAVADVIQASRLPDDMKPIFAARTPLLLYLLAEAQLQQRGEQTHGAHLGRLGSRIVGDVLLAALCLSGGGDDGYEWDQHIDARTPRSMPELVAFSRGLQADCS